MKNIININRINNDIELKVLLNKKPTFNNTISEQMKEKICNYEDL